jgi:hypothetical protein
MAAAMAVAPKFATTAVTSDAATDDADGPDVGRRRREKQILEVIQAMADVAAGHAVVDAGGRPAGPLDGDDESGGPRREPAVRIDRVVGRLDEAYGIAGMQ